MTKPRIGVLGGMGPAATILLQQRVLDAVPAVTDADHIPLLIDMNTQVPSRIDFLIHERGTNPGPVLAQMALGLEKGGADALVMPCCTAHHFAKYITDAATVPFLNILQLTSSAVARQVPQNAKVGILASPATDKVGLFKGALEADGLIAVFPKDGDKMLGAIQNIKSKGVSPEDIAVVQDAIAELFNAGVSAFIVGCSEFSMISRQLTSDVPIVDALDELTNAIVTLTNPSQ